MRSARERVIVVSLLCLALPFLFSDTVRAGGETLEYQPLGELAVDVAGIGLVVSLLFFLVRKALPPEAREWYFEDHPWLVNLSVIVVSVGVALLGAWLNALGFQPRSVVEYIWLGLFSAAVATLGYEFTKNISASGS